ncbi:acyl-CoA dehydrogenase [Nocardioides sp. YIM 152315]|uniref:acyl-CoA dehydrogenase n=1 Tax=Nocardioides sp. YIM 152315 TaxID=3031760 RepID=UPI0023DB2474|nr:acyl-CoA dehydrogenase [Nocardioides sp. YIM 152315]MDF1604120.1 acyl-CoA dehydrogenase [Nocardioides sp. YIM 152315]
MPRPTSSGSLAIDRDHLDLRDSVRKLLDRHVTDTVVRNAVEAKHEERPPFWGALAGQGLLALHLPEEVGGAGCTLLETAVVVEELGRAMTPGPFLPTVLASAVLHRAGHTRLLAGLADGASTAAVALESGTLVGTRGGDGALDVSGTSAPALGAQVADVFVLPVDLDGDLTWVVLRRDDVETEKRPSHDLTRRLSPVRVRASVTATDVLALDPRLPLDLAATLFAAEASGLADWATWTAAEHARVREQFGRPIGQFQGVKHRTAWSLAVSEQARVCAWDAARAQDPAVDPQEAALAAAVAGAISVDAGFRAAKDCLNTLGGIGFTWEHDAHLYLRRAQTLRLLLGPANAWQRRVAELTLAGAHRELGIELPREADRIRGEVRAELSRAGALEGAEQQRFLADHGYTAPHLPRPWGKGADAVTQLVIAEELRAAGLTPHDMIIGNWVVPTLIEHGDDHQRQRFVPASLAGDLVWCQLFSEPGAGSDLAGLSTRAERVDGGWRINGQKVWTSGARDADLGILLARTNADAPKHRGLSYFLLDMSTEGIDVRPLRELTGEALFNEVFLDDVFIPDDMLVGQPGDGWKLARTTLANERVALSSDSPALGSGPATLLGLVADDPAPDAHRLAELGRILGDAHAGGLFALRTAIRQVAGVQPGAESSVAKLLGVAHIQEVWETAMAWQGAAALDGAPQRRTPTWSFLSSRSLSIAGGTTDVQLNIIGERILGLPRDTEPTAKA